MDKQEMILNLKDRILYNEEQCAYYEGLHAEGVAKGDTITVWSEMVDWYKGKIIAFNIALGMAEELESA